jgi:hypothetical protein
MWAIVAILILVRASRPQRISVTRMWIQAIVLMAIGVAAIYGYQQLHPAPPWQIALGIVFGVAAGVPVGVLRGLHTQVSATEKHGVMQLGPSWITAFIYITAFGVRALLRSLVPATSSLGTLVGDGVLIFAIAIIGTTYWFVYRKYEALDRAMETAT